MNCGQCGKVCNLQHATSTCPAAACAIGSCSAGFFDCDAVADSGCECAGQDRGDGMKGCCAGGCQTMHQDGFMHTFYDCLPAGSYSLALAKDAGLAYGLASPVERQLTCGTTQVYCTVKNKECACWSYADTTDPTAVGRAHYNRGNVDPCVCPAAGDPTWN
jgi:hypothetical protein